MKVVYRITIDVESDTDRDTTPDGWNWDELMQGVPTQVVSYEILTPKNPVDKPE